VPKIPERFIDDLLTRVDLQDLVGRYVTLKKAGGRYVGVCPFHGDKDPSLSVTPDKGLWYCFGCHEGGNVISFIKKKENLDFVDAVIFLANLYNIPVPEGEADPNAVRRRTLYDINDRAREIYVKILKSKHGRPFREYLMKRGFKGETILAYDVGASVRSWDFLTKRLRTEGFPDEELLKAGLVIEGKQKGTVYDRFRGRLMIPIIDTLNRTLGFGGRAMGDDSPKYINSPESPVFQKSKILFGLNLAKDACRESRQLVVMEGYTDVMHAHQAGVKNCCAVMGTALTREHVPVLHRFADEVILSFDGDEAGKKATLKSIAEMGDVDFSLKVLELPQGADPADVIVSNGAGEFRKRLEKAIPAADWMFRSVADTVRNADLKTKLRAFRDVAPYILAHRSRSVRDELTERAALAFSTVVPAIQQVLNETARGSKGEGSRSSSGAIEAILQDAQEVERQFFVCLLANPEYLHEAKTLLDPDDCYDPLHRRLARILFQEGFAIGSPDSLMRIPEIFDDDMLRGYVVRLTQCLYDEPEEDVEDGRYSIDALKKSLKLLHRRKYDEQSNRLRTEIAELSQKGASKDNEKMWATLIEKMLELDNLEKDYWNICMALGGEDSQR
jgi:DNA primase